MPPAQESFDERLQEERAVTLRIPGVQMDNDESRVPACVVGAGLSAGVHAATPFIDITMRRGMSTCRFLFASFLFSREFFAGNGTLFMEVLAVMML